MQLVKYVWADLNNLAEVVNLELEGDWDFIGTPTVYVDGDEVFGVQMLVKWDDDED